MTTARPELPYPCSSQAKSREETSLRGKLCDGAVLRIRQASFQSEPKSYPRNKNCEITKSTNTRLQRDFVAYYFALLYIVQMSTSTHL